jgi:hypothetical protein
MIEELVEANGFHEAYACLDQPHIRNELLEIADRARRGEEAGKEAENSAVR